jgi:hypothetical protein
MEVEMRDMNRRAVLAGAATLPALTLPAIAAEPDPIFAAIEKHQKLNAAHVAACDAIVPFSHASQGKLTPAIATMEDHAGHLCDAAFDALAELAAMTPRTVAGCAALLRHVENCVTRPEYFDQGNLFQDFREDVEKPAKTMLSRIAATLDHA